MELLLLHINSQSNNLRLLTWRQARLFDDDLDNDVATAPLLVIANAGADQLPAVTFEELLCAFLAESQYLPSPHKRPPGCYRKFRLIDYC